MAENMEILQSLIICFELPGGKAGILGDDRLFGAFL